MKISFEVCDAEPGTLSGPQVLVVPVSSDRRPLLCFGGRVDWELCGELSRLISQEQFSGVQGERLLRTTPSRMTTPFVFLFGVGRTDEFGAGQLVGTFRAIAGLLSDANVTKVAFSISDFSALANVTTSEAASALLAGWVAGWTHPEVVWWLAEGQSHASEVSLELGRIAERYTDIELEAYQAE